MNIDSKATLRAQSGAQKIGVRVSENLPKVKGPEMNIRDQLNDILIGEKHLVNTYQIAINESIQPDLRNLLVKLRDKTTDTHWRVFASLYNMGEYQADLAGEDQRQDADDVFSGYRAQLPYERDGSPVPLTD